MTQGIVNKTFETLFFDAIEAREITVQTGAHMQLVGVLTEGWSDHRIFTVNLTGDGASVDCVFAFVGSGVHTFPFDIVIRHQHSNTQSNVRIRSVLSGASSIDSEGRIHIEKGAKNAATYFSHHALLVGKNARATIVPSLEIEHNDVRAGHAVTVGRIDEEALFYCATRGVDRHDAIQLVTRGFLLADSACLRDAGLRKTLEHKIDSTLHCAYAKS